MEKHLTGVVCTSCDLRIVPIFWDTKNLLCETIDLLWETMNLLQETMNLPRETMHTDETSCNVAYYKIFDRNDSGDKSFDREKSN